MSTFGHRTIHGNLIADVRVISVFIKDLFIDFGFICQQCDRLSVFPRSLSLFFLCNHLVVVPIHLLAIPVPRSSEKSIQWLDVNERIMHGQRLVIFLHISYEANIQEAKQPEDREKTDAKASCATEFAEETRQHNLL